MNNYQQRIIVALDVEDGKSALKLLKELKGLVHIVKIGSVLFCKEGPQFVKEVRESGVDVFLDLKFHDIPNTVSHALEAVFPLGVKMLTLHASGGSKMIRQAKEMASEQALSSAIEPPILLCVTALTSLDENILKTEIGVQESVEDWVIRLAGVAKSGGADGIVASAMELPVLRKKFGEDWIIVCPGIRIKEERSDDQKRIMSAASAFQKGASFIVIGRPICKADNPRRAFEMIIQDARYKI